MERIGAYRDARQDGGRVKSAMRRCVLFFAHRMARRSRRRRYHRWHRNAAIFVDTTERGTMERRNAQSRIYARGRCRMRRAAEHRRNP